jgi:fused signal recognition particle receptor
MAESFIDRFRKGLERTRDILNADVEDLVRGRRPLKPEDLDAIEEGLIAADLGLPATQQAMEVLRAKSAQIWTGGAEAMRGLLRDEIRSILTRRRPSCPSRRSRGSCSWSA